MAILAGISLIRVLALASGAIDLSGDEAHYWEWSRRLDWCYYSKPPGVAYLIRLGTAVFGDTALGVRSAAVVLSFLSSLVLYKLGTRMYDAATGFAAAILLQIVPLFAAFGVGMTPDAPLILFWILALWFFHKALSEETPWSWLLLMVALGMGLLFKYAIAFFYIPALALLVGYKDNRWHLRRPWPYVTLVGSLLFFTPVILWNSRHDWVMFRHDLMHAGDSGGLAISLSGLVNFLGSQFGVVTPILLVLIVLAVIRQRKEDPFSFWFCIPILAGFLLKSSQGKVQGNWPMVAYITGVVGFAAFLVRHYTTLDRGTRTWVIAGLIIPLIGTIFLTCPALMNLVPFPPKINPLKKLVGWEDLGRQVSRYVAEMESPLFIFSDYYMDASELAFYVEGRPSTYCVSLGRRMNQYDIWPGFGDLVGHNAIYVSRYEMPPKLTEAFDRCEKKTVTVHDKKGRPIQDYAVYLCHDFQGMERPKPDRY